MANLALACGAIAQIKDPPGAVNDISIALDASLRGVAIAPKHPVGPAVASFAFIQAAVEFMEIVITGGSSH